VQPETLRAYGLTVSDVYAAVAKSNMPPRRRNPEEQRRIHRSRRAGSRTKGHREHRHQEGQRHADLREQVAKVQVGLQFRRSVYEKDGNEMVAASC